MKMTRYMKAREDLFFLLGEIQRDGSSVQLTPQVDGKLLARIFDTDNKPVRSMIMDYPLLSGEQALPILSKVEWDETTQQIQQRTPVKYLFRIQKPRTSDRKLARLYGKRGGKKKNLTVERLIELAVTIEADFLDFGDITG